VVFSIVVGIEHKLDGCMGSAGSCIAIADGAPKNLHATATS
jgi:hypothetical protein